MIYKFKNSIITCLHCNVSVYKLTRDVNLGEVIDARDVEGINGHDNPSNGSKFVCPNCNKEIWSAL